MDKISQVKQLIREINRLQGEFSKDYFETGKINSFPRSCVGMHTELNEWVEAAIKLLSQNSLTL